MSLEGKKLDHYRLLHIIGSGGMGEVYLAEDSQLRRQVAVKVIKIGGAQDSNEAVAQTLRLFLREATAIARLDHPHILPLYDYGEEVIDAAHVAYLIMPYRAEGSLVSWLRKRAQAPQTRQVTLRQVEHLIQQAAKALQYAHDHQIIHQDIKPANFLIRNNAEADEYPDLLLTDFGIARLESGTSNASQNVRGTPTYMAPEQWAAQAVFASDQYALAVMTYELLTGSPPFQGAPMKMMYAHLHTPPTPPRELNPLLPPSVDTLLLRALAKKPEERFASVTVFARAFQAAFQGVDEGTTLQVLRSSPSTPHTPGASRPNDIQATLGISAEEARSGAVRTLTLPGGRKVHVHIPPGALDGQRLTLPGQGEMLGPGNTGNLYLTLSIVETLAQPSTAASETDPTYHKTQAPTIAGEVVLPSHQPQPAGPVPPASILSRQKPVIPPAVATPLDVFTPPSVPNNTPPGLFIPPPAPPLTATANLGLHPEMNAAVLLPRSDTFSMGENKTVDAPDEEEERTLADSGGISELVPTKPLSMGSRRRPGKRRLILIAASMLVLLSLIASAAAHTLLGSSSRLSIATTHAPVSTSTTGTTRPTSLPSATATLPPPPPGSATVLITPASQQVNNTFTITGVTGTPGSRQMQARQLSATTSTQTKTVPATGQITTSPATQASGKLQLFNYENSSVTFNAGTTYSNNSPDPGCSSPPQIDMVLDTTITVPPAPSGGGGTFVTAAGHVLQAGSIGNFNGSLCFQWNGNSGVCPPPHSPSCLKVICFTSFTGGQDAHIDPVVQQSDIDSAANSLISANQPNAQQMLQGQVQSNERFAGTPDCSPNVSANQKAGDKVAQVTVSVNFTCTGEVYDYAGALSLGGQLLTNQAASNPGGGYALVGQISTNLNSASLGGGGTVTLVVSASGFWVYQFSALQQRALAQLIAGKSVQEAQQLLNSQAGVARASINLPSNSGQTLPSDVSKIQVVIQSVSGG